MSIFPKSAYSKVYTGSQITVNYLRAVLDDAQIPFMTRDDGQSARMGGFAINYLNEIVIFVKNEDVLQAKQLINKSLEAIENTHPSSED